MSPLCAKYRYRAPLRNSRIPIVGAYRQRASGHSRCFLIAAGVTPCFEHSA